MILERMIFLIVLALATYVSNFRSLVFWRLHPPSEGFTGQIWIELSYWFLAIFLMAWLLVRTGNLGRYFHNWLQYRSLILFLIICIVSVSWSQHRTETIFHSIVLVASTLIAAYIGMHCKPRELLSYLSWFATTVVVASIYIFYVDSLLAINRFYGSDVWRGIFWNKNHLGAIAALAGTLLLLEIVNTNAISRPAMKCILAGAYIGAMVLVFKAHSAAGYLVALILHILVCCFYLWRQFRSRLQRRHYVVVGLVIVLISAALLGNLDHILQMMNKNATLTGRTLLWTWLLQDVVSQKPILGYGYGAMWGDLEFQARAKSALNFVPVIADNGFLDILLGVGSAGLTSLLVVYFYAWRGALRYVCREAQPSSCLPLLLMTFSLCANISFSLLTEIEVLVWGLIVVVLYSTADHTLPLNPMEQGNVQ